MPPPQPITLSASSMAAFQQCPAKFQMAYQEFIRPAEDSNALRQGTNTHALFENVGEAPDAEVVEYVSKLYEDVPANKNSDDWETERNTLLALFLNYRTYWSNDPVEVIAREEQFKLEIAPGLMIQGKVDGIGTWQGKPVIIERKTTSSALDDQDYWTRLLTDVQVSTYVLYLAEKGQRLSVLYDVIRKPTIRRGKKETPQEFYERLHGDINERPEHYYARREIPRLDADLDRFRTQIRRMARAIRSYIRDESWWQNWSACRNPYPCYYNPICLGCGPEEAIKNVPAGFTRLTVGGR